MKIRSITCFSHVGAPLIQGRLDDAGRFLLLAQKALRQAGFEVQTTRLALPPFPATAGLSPESLAEYASELERATQSRGIDYVTVGPSRPHDDPQWTAAIPELLRETRSVFAAALIATPHHGVHLPAIRRVADVVVENAPLEENGFANLRFAALANVPGGTPFLPAAYHESPDMSFALATEAADLAVDAFADASTLAEARSKLVSAIEDQWKRLETALNSLLDRWPSTPPQFGGVDFSMAPFPEDRRSIGVALESLGVQLGRFGGLTASAFLANAVDEARIPRTGFSGLFLPVLEDGRLADRAAENVLGLADVLLYSAVCGTGLDTIPLAGNVTSEEIAPILMDVATLALRLDKPLTARLMPMPGRKAGDAVTFDFPYFADGRVMDHDAQPLKGLLNGDESFAILPRRR